MVETLSPEWGVFRWAWYRAKEYRTRFWVGAALFSLVVAVIISRLPLPPHPTADQNLIATVLAVVGATAATGVGTYACALAAAPFQQRNVLRTRVHEASAVIAALRVSPVPQAHGVRLRETATRLRTSLQDYAPLDYGDDPDIWCRAFNEHFPELRPSLDKAREAEAALGVLKERLQKETTNSGMGTLPWTATEFLPWLATTIQARAIQQILGTTYNFDWQDLGPGSVYIGDPVYTGHQILQDGDPSDIPTLKDVFENFFKSAESWPEAVAIRSTWDERKSAEDTTVRLLAEASSTDPITSRCFLCKGAPSN